MTLLTDEDKKNILNYKYNGGDSSPVYKYVLSPIAQFFVDNFLPRWLAPNMVTLLGLAASIISLYLTLLFNPSLDKEAPRWVYVVTGLCVLAYQTFDNMDGKQARRTGSSSALGMLFDHGCDALNSGIMCIPLASVMMTGWSTKFFMCMWSGFVPFYFQAFEEYYVGEMVLPPFNGPTEGLLIAAAMCFISAYAGPQFWHHVIYVVPDSICNSFRASMDAVSFPAAGGASAAISECVLWHFKEITPFSVITLFAVTSSSIIAVQQTYTVMMHVRHKENSVWSVTAALLDLLPFLAFFPSVLTWFAMSQLAFPQFPLIAFLYAAAVNVEILMHIMVKHICNGKLQPLERHGALLAPLLPLLSWAAQVSNRFSAVLLRAEFVVMVTLSGYATYSAAAFLYQICSEFAMLLNLYILVLGKRDN